MNTCGEWDSRGVAGSYERRSVVFNFRTISWTTSTALAAVVVVVAAIVAGRDELNNSLLSVRTR